MKNKILKSILISALVLITLGACSAQADTTAGSTRKTTQTSN